MMLGRSIAGATTIRSAWTTPCLPIKCGAEVMSSSPFIADTIGPASWPRTPASALQVVELLPRVRCADRAESAAELFRQLTHLIGADSGVFLSAIRDDAMRTSIRSLMACDPRWAVEYARPGRQDQDPWLRYALDSQTPIRSTDLVVRPWEEEFVLQSSKLGFRSALVVPAPTSFGAARVGVLVLGSNLVDRFHGEDAVPVQIVARAMAMELHESLLGVMRADLLKRSGIRPDELDLLRYEAAGHTSKVIAGGLDVTPKAVRRRFERAMRKLNAPDRETAVRIARLYGLI